LIAPVPAKSTPLWGGIIHDPALSLPYITAALPTALSCVPQTVRLLNSLARAKLGSNIAISKAMIAMTTKSSTNVNPLVRRMGTSCAKAHCCERRFDARQYRRINGESNKTNDGMGR
jgi:hypothetical protein